ncbi:hypothetical protein HY522_09790 [bacterium]|nr:hypothetical protein [bacterium]
MALRIFVLETLEAAQILRANPVRIFNFDRQETVRAVDDKIDIETGAAAPEEKLYSRKTSGARRSIRSASPNRRRTHVDFPVPRGPNRKKL